MSALRLSILGTVGVPGNYGGFETLAENLVRFHASQEFSSELSVYCSSKALETLPEEFEKAELRYVGFEANGAQSIIYDICSLFDAARRRTDVILLLGVSGAFALPLVRFFFRSRIVTNIDGIEWKRDKWKGLARLILRCSERVAVRWSHAIVADNAAIADYVRDMYGQSCHVIAYGGDHALLAEPISIDSLDLPPQYVLALCRIEPENNVAMILDALARMPDHNLVFIGNWAKSSYGRKLRAKFSGCPNLYLLDPVYDPSNLRWVRSGARTYIHGHSAGGTNPSLVEMMHFGIPVIAFDCAFNRYTTENRAAYFESADQLRVILETQDNERAQIGGAAMKEIAARRYKWEIIGHAYFELLESVV